LFVFPLARFTIHALDVLLDWVDDAEALHSEGLEADPGVPGYGRAKG